MLLLLRQLLPKPFSSSAISGLVVFFSVCVPVSVYATESSATEPDSTPLDTISALTEIAADLTTPTQTCAEVDFWVDPVDGSCPSLGLWQQPLFPDEAALMDGYVLPLSYAAADLGGELVANLTTAQQTTPQPASPDAPPVPTTPAPVSPPPPPPSDALNLPVLRSLKKPTGRKVLDTGVAIAGIRPKDTSENFWTRDFFTGNWGGSRDRDLRRGIDLYLALFSDVYSNVGGGKSQNTAFNNVVLAGFDLYTSKLGWWREGQIHVTAVDIRGVSVGRDYAGSLSSTYFVDPIKRGARLFEVWYGQKFGNTSQYELRVGKIFPFVRIAASQITGIFTNTAFQYPTYLGVSPNTGMSTPFASSPLGVQFSYTPGPQWLFIGQLQDGFDDPTGGSANQDGLNTGISAREGIEGIFEAVYRPNQERGSTGLPGFYRLGFQFHSGVFRSQSKNVNGLSRALFGGDRQEDVGNYAIYFMADQMVFRESPNPRDRTQGLNVFFKSVVTPKQDINTISLNITGGLAYEGLIPGRDRDVLGLGVSYSRFSDGIRTFDRETRRLNPTTPIRDAETVLELVYVAEITPWWYLIGSVQRIFQPNGNSTIPDATVLGISSRIAF
ncbi:MAG: carbohydrate porin [Leptolyngbyaceae cyanobacterium bins.302]|nr:carbohydrate porin [Leptolyngbyaceae cyanobacterium bins.302]